ncbi:pseudouridine synthase [Zopfia rhizophila CBS 207.26]|uniref:Pseudouridine synthase n=1 Tax=Zopfia rhizophila CBS 207.26 TaxID=1314779 RepID=A0A6A6E6X1_9PEZI|nr:pseudouridine synthase [Zopfia rhizophila CBS 207.26]
MGSGEYSQWNQQQLIERINELESQIKAQTQSAPPAPPATADSSIFPNPPLSDGPPRIPYRKPPKQPPKAFDASKYSTRLIALKFAYLGQRYNGFEHHKNNKTPLPTIEEELWKALVKTRLINPIPARGEGSEDYGRIDYKKIEAWDQEGADVNWDGCEYSKCGRTDRGVSAFGQVIGVRVRSNRPVSKHRSPPPSATAEEADTSTHEQEPSLPPQDSEPEEEEKPFDDIKGELPYIQLLNRVLPPDIRIYAWCPNPPPNFSARFSCKERRYKYFFTNPCFPPVPGASGLYTPQTSLPSSSEASIQTMQEGWLDITAMKRGCTSLLGLHDFRNFCKLDASKQLTNFQRRIFHADIEEISPLSIASFLFYPSLQNPTVEQPKVYAFTLHGSAFLWHQVRSIVAILFLIGQGLESPSIIPQLLDISTNPTKPKYEMASDAPLVLWDCIFPVESEIQSTEVREKGYEDNLNWIYVGDEGGVEPKGKSGGGGVGRGKWGRGGLMDDLWEVWRGHKIEETLSGLLMDVVAHQGKIRLRLDEEKNVTEANQGKGKAKLGGVRVFDGGDVAKAKGNYIPVLSRERQEPVEVVNERYAKKKGLNPTVLRSRDEDADE